LIGIIKIIPKEIGNLINLTFLFLNDNQIEIIPKEMGNLRVNYLNIKNNPIRELSLETREKLKHSDIEEGCARHF
jgi:Leucine-rich repeat (LRR) protein